MFVSSWLPLIELLLILIIIHYNLQHLIKKSTFTFIQCLAKKSVFCAEVNIVRTENFSWNIFLTTNNTDCLKFEIIEFKTKR